MSSARSVCCFCLCYPTIIHSVSTSAAHQLLLSIQSSDCNCALPHSRARAAAAPPPLRAVLSPGSLVSSPLTITVPCPTVGRGQQQRYRGPSAAAGRPLPWLLSIQSPNYNCALPHSRARAAVAVPRPLRRCGPPSPLAP